MEPEKTDNLHFFQSQGAWNTINSVINRLFITQHTLHRNFSHIAAVFSICRIFFYGYWTLSISIIWIWKRGTWEFWLML